VLKTALRPTLPPGMEKLAAYQEQRKKHERVKNKFSQKLQMHIRNMFTHLVSMDFVFKKSSSSMVRVEAVQRANRC
jgi:hypothetical protein